MRTKGAFLIIGIAFFILGLSAGVSSAADSEVMRNAKKEGKAVWYASIPRPIGQEICANFNKKKLGINCEYVRVGGGAFLRRVLQETGSGIHAADVFHSTSMGYPPILKKRKLLAKYAPKGIERFPNTFRDPEGYYYILRVGLFMPAYNTNKLKASDVPRTWKGLLDPKWRGKLVMGHPGFSAGIYTLFQALRVKFGWEYFRELEKLSPRIVKQATEVGTFISSGESSLSVGGIHFIFYNRIKKGDPIKVIYPEEFLPILVMFNSVAEKAPHPNAARVLTDYLFSQEAQQILVNRGLLVGHPDVKYEKGRKRLDELKYFVVDPDVLQKTRKDFLKKFREIFGV